MKVNNAILAIFFNSDPMRITKKFAGSSCIGKQVFSPTDAAVEPEKLQQVQVI
jgi:hypothetical protein